MRTILTWKWRGHTMGKTRPEYTAGHVNRLLSALYRHHHAPFELVCVTDDAEGLDPRVRVIPIWEDLAEHGRCYRRLRVFARDAASWLGCDRFTSLDLDTVICGRVDDLLDRTEPFVIWADPSRRIPYCGSMWQLKCGAYPEVFEQFNPEIALNLKQTHGWHGSDQAWFAYMLRDAAFWGKHDGVYSMRMHLMKVQGRDPANAKTFKRWIEKHGAPRLPANARIVHFHGELDPSFLFLQKTVPWIAEHWR